MPTGSGKSHVIASLAEHYASQGLRTCILAHRKELLFQTAEKITSPIGYYGASLGDRNADELITIGSIQTIYDKDVSKMDVIIVDECHLCPNNTELGQYWHFIDKHQPCKIIGLTATPWRLQGGNLGWGETVYKISYEALKEHLSPISNKLVADAQPDLSKVQVKMGEYVENQIAAIMEAPELVEAAVKVMIAYSENRHSVLVFCVSVAHARLLTSILKDNGQECAVITGETAQGHRDSIIADFKAEMGATKFLLNCEVLTVGFDAPNIDMIVCLRPTKSKTLWEQMCGRGARKAEGKTNCLLIDMAGNLNEHGPLGTPYKEKSRKEAPENPNKICPQCEEYVPPLTKECPDCGYLWPEPARPKVSHRIEPDMGEYQGGGSQSYLVRDVSYKKHLSKKGNYSLMVRYDCTYGKYGNIAEWVPEFRIDSFFRARGEPSPPRPIDWDWVTEQAAYLKKPVEITVDHSGEFPRVIKYMWEAPKEIETHHEDGLDLDDVLDGDYIPI